jgi:hypothetical protein
MTWLDRKESVKLYLGLTILLCGLTLFASLIGILVKSTYARETTNWAEQARGQDIINVAAVAMMLIVTYLIVTKHSVTALLVWAGGLLFLIYGFVIFAFASHFNNLFLVYVATLGVAVYTFLGGVLRLDFEAVKRQFPISNRKRVAASILLLVLALAFYGLWLSEDIPSLLKGTVPASVATAGLLVNPVHVLDMALYLPAFIITAVSLWRKNALGYTFALPLMVFALLTVLGIVAIVFVS